ncbi:hypothetical protein OROGR_005421 [Orobanche gracilis]
MKSHHHHQQQPKLKTQLFSCAFFRHCAQTVLSPTATATPPLPLTTTPPPPLIKPSDQCESSTSSSSSTTSFTQWRFSLPTTPTTQNDTATLPPPPSPSPSPSTIITIPNLQELFHVSELQLTTDPAAALHLLERSLVPNPPQEQPPCPPQSGARGKEYAIGVLAVIYGSAVAEQMTVELALQGECSARGKMKGAQLLRTRQHLSHSPLTTTKA